MYHPAVIAERERRLLEQPTFRAQFPQGLPRCPIAVSQANAARLAEVVDEEGTLKRRLAPDEAAFVTAERLVCKIDYRYCAERYIQIRKATPTGMRIKPLYPLWESQELVLARMAAREAEVRETGNPDGLLFDVLKARQLGITTLTESIILHRGVTASYQSGLIAADVTEQSGYMFNDIFLGMLEALPWYLKPGVKLLVTAGEKRHIYWTNHSIVRMSSGKSMRGKLQEESGVKKGNIGRGRTQGLVHLSEIPSWEYPDQIDTALEPGIPVMHDAFAIMEATAKGREDYFHQHWRSAVAGESRWGAIFIPWWAEPKKYSLPAPPEWTPTAVTLSHARRAEEIGPSFVGHAVHLTRDQLYWYERRRTAMAKANRLSEFLEEFPAEPEEAFQHSGRSIFGADEIARLQTLARPLASAYEFDPDAMATLVQ
jgi:hypothetical protein